MEDNRSTIAPNAILLCGKSWTAYINVTLLALVLIVLTGLTYLWLPLAAAVVFVVSLLIVGYSWLVIRSFRLYYDDIGVWAYSGILPWNKGVSGVKWRDMDEATFEPGFWSWLFKSYSIRIGHRFTKSSEIFLTGMAHGREAVTTLNARQQDMIRSGTVGDGRSGL